MLALRLIPFLASKVMKVGCFTWPFLRQLFSCSYKCVSGENPIDEEASSSQNALVSGMLLLDLIGQNSAPTQIWSLN